DRYYSAKRLHIEVERPVFGAEVRDAYSGNLFDPLVSDTGTNHESAVALALVGEHVEKASDVIAPDPRVWHVADELRRFRIAINNLGPLVPRLRPLSLEKEIEQLVRARALTELHLHANGAELVGR